MLCRPAPPIVLVLLLALGPAARPAAGGFIDFLPGPLDGPPASLTFGADGSLTGTIPVVALSGVGTPFDDGRTVAVAGGLATFTLGTAAAVPFGYLYKGGSIVVTGTLAGRSAPETLFSMAFLPGELSSDQGGPDGWLTVDPLLGSPAVASDVAGLFGAASGLGAVTMGFAGTPGGPTRWAVAEIRLNTGGVPGPGTLGLVAAGLVLGRAGMGRRRSPSRCRRPRSRL